MVYRDSGENLFENHYCLIFIDSSSAVDELLQASTIAELHKNQF